MSVEVVFILVYLGLGGLILLFELGAVFQVIPGSPTISRLVHRHVTRPKDERPNLETRLLRLGFLAVYVGLGVHLFTDWI